jgi:ABC-type lipoprotein release transport system permease subunit
VLAIVGVAAGLLGAWLSSRTLATLLYGVRPHDPMTRVAATVLLPVVVFAATLLPAPRASRVAPASALRTD